MGVFSAADAIGRLETSSPLSSAPCAASAHVGAALTTTTTRLPRSLRRRRQSRLPLRAPENVRCRALGRPSRPRSVAPCSTAIATVARCRGAPTRPASASTTSALRHLGFRESAVNAVLAELRAHLALADAPVESLLREALCRITPRAR